MKSLKIVKSNNISFIVILLGMIALYLYYFFIYIPNQEDKVQQRAFRILEEYGNNIQEKYDYYEGHFDNYGEFYISKDEYKNIDSIIGKYKKDLNTLENDTIDPNIKEPILQEYWYSDFYNSVDELIAEIDDYVNLLIDAKEIFGTLEEEVEIRNIDPANYNESDISFDDYYYEDSTLSVQTESKGVSKKIKLVSKNEPYEIVLESDDPNLEAIESILIRKVKDFLKQDTSSASKKAFLVKDDSTHNYYSKFVFEDYYWFQIPVIYLPFTKLMEGLKYDQLLESIILFNQHDVVYSSDPNQLLEISNPKQIIDSAALSQGGFIQQIEVRGQTRQMITVPLRIEGENLYLAGFISDQKFTAKTRSIDNQFLVILTSLVLLLLVGIPFLKIIFINRYERLNASDSTNSLLAFFLSVGIFILVIAGVLRYSIVDKWNADKSLAFYSEKLTQNVNSDLNEILKIYLSISGLNAVDDTLAKAAIDVFTDADTNFVIIDSTLFMSRIPINEILLINDTGVISQAFSSQFFPQSISVDVKNRNYFKNIVAKDKSWDIRQRTAMLENVSILSNIGFFIESIRSLNTQKQEAAISFSTEKVTIGGEKVKEPVLAITSRLPSLFDQVLPDGVQFIIINNKGRVLFHSNANKNLHENFINESEGATGLSGAIKHRTASDDEIYYNEQKWFMRAVPVEGTPLYHITLISKENFQNRNARVFLFSFYFLLLTLLVILAGMQMMRVMRKKSALLPNQSWSFDWLYFRADKKDVYIHLLMLQSLILILQIAVAIVVKSPVLMLLVQIGFIAISGLVAFLLLNKEESLLTKMLNVDQFSQKIVKAINIVISESPRKAFLAFMFIWLLVVIVAPVLQYYQSIRMQEEKLWLRHQLHFMADQNLKRNHYYKGEAMETSWFQRIIGQNLIGKKITVQNGQTKYFGGSNLTALEEVYLSMPDPLTDQSGVSDFLNNSSQHAEWNFDEQTFEYSAAGQDGQVKIYLNESEFDQPKYLSGFLWLLYLIIPMLIIALIVWLIFVYLVDNILNALHANWVHPAIDPWPDVLKDDKKRRIILNSFFEDRYLNEARTLFKKNKNGTEKMEIVSFSDLVKDNYTINTDRLSDVKLIWINGVADLIRDVNKHQNIQQGLIRLSQVFEGKIVLSFPYELDYINELYDEFDNTGKAYENELKAFYHLKQTWKMFFRDFYKYTGKLTLEDIGIDSNLKSSNPADLPKIYGLQNLLQIRYAYIWNSLCSFEKLIVYDLADDGMVNLKNKYIINRLAMKGLIDNETYPKLFHETFQYYLVSAIKPEEASYLEQKMSKQGTWKNMRILILLLLLPLGGFVLMAQGTSIDKVIGIFAGVLALISGMARLFDSGMFKQSSG